MRLATGSSLSQRRWLPCDLSGGEGNRTCRMAAVALATARAHDATNKEHHVCARRRDGEAAGVAWRSVDVRGNGPSSAVEPTEA